MNKTKLAILAATALLSVGATAAVSANETGKQMPTQTVTFNGGCDADHDHSQEVNKLRVTRPLLTIEGVAEDIVNEPFEIEDVISVKGKMTRMGYQWACTTKGCGYVSEWHAFNATASQYALAHHMKYGHSVVVYGV